MVLRPYKDGRNKKQSAQYRMLRSCKGTLPGPSDRIRTCGILLPKQARYQLRYTRIRLPLYRKRKENATEIFGSLSGIAKEAGGWYNGRKNRREDCVWSEKEDSVRRR